ncbi:MAG TPA: hypothetical protein VFZ25_14765 [Chloroflexota bacterium]|nr:hypothetical protein [Chloroflexota bacterium]
MVVESRTRNDLALLLGGRGKRDLIADMLVRSPHPAATEKLMLALEPYPLVYLLLAAEFPTRIWIIDRDERVSSAEILTPEMRNRRWHSTAIHIDECEGLTDAAPHYLAMVTSWRSMLIMRHEFAHVMTTFFSPQERKVLIQLYNRAHSLNHFMEPLARESVGEYLACALGYTFFADLDEELARFDPALHRFVNRVRDRGEDFSRTLVASL